MAMLLSPALGGGVGSSEDRYIARNMSSMGCVPPCLPTHEAGVVGPGSFSHP